jgi:hypothetical protein
VSFDEVLAAMCQVSDCELAASFSAFEELIVRARLVEELLMEVQVWLTLLPNSLSFAWWKFVLDF